MADIICQKCGKKFTGHYNTRYCDACHPVKNRPKRVLITPGKTYGAVKVIKRAERSYCAWECRCQKCGQFFVGTATDIRRLEEFGCPSCRAKALEAKKVEDLQKEVGRFYGNLKVTGVSYDNRDGKGKRAYAACECQICGGMSEIYLSRLRSGGASKCAACSRKVLAPGREIGKKMHVDGTFIPAINGGRAVNKNSSTGHTGVSYHKQTGKYRAYIFFKRRQYSLGLYDKIEDAVAARKAAEKEMYGDFLEWYAAEHPEQWERINRKRKK